MPYNNRNKLLQMQAVIAIYKREKRDGVTTISIWRNHIYPVYHISLSTFYNYLSTPVDKNLKECQQSLQ